jgi:nucleoside-diphosphate-sugar epimerase
MTIVVTGCRGQLGAELCRQFGAEAVGFDLPEFDLTDRAAVVAVLSAIQPRAVVNAAAFTLWIRRNGTRRGVGPLMSTAWPTSWKPAEFSTARWST